MAAKKDPPKPSTGKSLQDFRAEHDKSYIVPKRIREAVAKLGDGWLYEVEFLRLAGLSTTDLAAYRDEFLDYVVNVGSAGGKTPRRIWAGTKALAQKMRDLL